MFGLGLIWTGLYPFFDKRDVILNQKKEHDVSCMDAKITYYFG